MTENSEIYSYDFLTHQPDMKVVELPALSEVQTDGRINREKIVADGIKNAEEKGEKLSDATAAVKNKYSGRNVIITKAAIKHSMGAENPSRLRTNARIGAICGDVIENALPINALKNENPEALGTYAMVAILQSGTRQIAAMVTVEQHTDKVTKIDTIDLAHALNGRIAKKEGSESSARERGYANSALPAITTFNLNIADVIQIVNTTHQSILSDDVLKALGEERNPEGYYAQRAKFSMAGPKAKTASSKNLALAEAMEEDGASREEIWRKTGWIRGADGQWRFEIDDSKAEFRPNGDARLLGEPRYRRLEELTDKWGDSFEKGGEALTEAEEAEMEALQEEYSDRVWEKKYELQDFLKHDELYEAYPMLRHTALQFERLDSGVKGKFDKRSNTIVLSDTLFGKEPETLLHEIQHVIQKIEGFQGGTSPEYWAQRDYESGDRLQERLQQEYSDLLNGLTKEEQNDYIRYQEIDGELERLFYSEKPGDTEKYDRLDAEHDRLYEKLYPKEWFGKLLDLKRQMENPGEVYLAQYRNSAGEIEARETASRRKLTAEERRENMPDLGWDRALLTEDAGDAKDAVLDGRLTADSTEQERYDLLKNETMTLARPDENKLNDIDLADFNTRKKSAVMPGMKALAKKLGIMNVDLQNSRIEIPFQFSNRGLTTSLHHQLEYGGSYQDYAKMMTCFNELIRNAVPIEVHGEKKAGTSRENPFLKQVYVLLGGYAEENSVVPVQFEVKEMEDQSENRLYLSVALTKIAPEVLEKALSGEPGSIPRLFSDAKVSIADIFRNVNSEDGRFLKYVPDGFLSEEQKAAKQEAIAKQETEYSNYRYSLTPTEKAQRAQERAETAIAKAEEAKQAAQESYKKELTGGLKKLFGIQSYDNEALEKSISFQKSLG